MRKFTIIVCGTHTIQNYNKTNIWVCLYHLVIYCIHNKHYKITNNTKHINIHWNWLQTWHQHWYLSDEINILPLHTHLKHDTSHKITPPHPPTPLSYKAYTWTKRQTTFNPSNTRKRCIHTHKAKHNMHAHYYSLYIPEEIPKK